MASAEKVYIIGIGEDGLEGLTATARRRIQEADVIIGAEHASRLLPAAELAKLVVANALDAAVDRVAGAANQRVVVLTSGDPLFYGTAHYFCDRLGEDRFEVVPHVSSMQLAFARIKESWEEAYLTNLANRPLPAVVERIRVAEKVGLFTTEDYTPAAVARTLLDAGIDYFSAYVCENLGSPDERVTRATLAEMSEQQFATLNVMILVRRPAAPDRPAESIGRRRFGNPDEAFLQSRPKHGLLTPAEVRTIAIAQLDLGPSSIVWDVGAGSGSVAIEAAQLAPGGRVFAIELDPDDHQLIRANAEAFGVSNLVPVLGQAPEAWSELPAPDCIFVGGSGRGVSRLVELAYQRLRPGGRLAATVASIENLVEVRGTLGRLASDVKIWMVNVARGTDQLDRVRFEALNPTFLLAVVKS